MRSPGNARTRIVLAFVAVLLSVGCAARSPSLSDLADQEVVGHYTLDNGKSWFRSCAAADSDRSWWVTFTGASVESSRGRFQPGARYFVRFRAAVTTGGEVGPQGPGVPALLVREILESAPAADGDCDPSS